jgi:hypothetical protein
MVMRARALPTLKALLEGAHEASDTEASEPGVWDAASLQPTCTLQNPQLGTLSVNLDVVRLRQRTAIDLVIQIDRAHG